MKAESRKIFTSNMCDFQGKIMLGKEETILTKHGKKNPISNRFRSAPFTCQFAG